MYKVVFKNLYFPWIVYPSKSVSERRRKKKKKSSTFLSAEVGELAVDPLGVIGAASRLQALTILFFRMDSILPFLHPFLSFLEARLECDR